MVHHGNGPQSLARQRHAWRRSLARCLEIGIYPVVPPPRRPWDLCLKINKPYFAGVITYIHTSYVLTSCSQRGSLSRPFRGQKMWHGPVSPGVVRDGHAIKYQRTCRRILCKLLYPRPRRRPMGTIRVPLSCPQRKLGGRVQTGLLGRPAWPL